MNLLVLAHPRSGHHAFIDWFCSHQLEPYTHLNDPFIKGNTITPQGGHKYEGRERVHYNLPMGAWETNLVANFERPDCRGMLLPWRPIIFIRSLETFLSSVVKLAHKLDQPDLPDLSVPAWDWCIERVSQGMPYVHFDRWVESAEYRIQVARSLGFETDGAPWERVSPFGGTKEKPGSSFDSTNLDGRASEMSVTFRDESQSPIYQRYATPERLEANKILSYDSPISHNRP